MLCRNDPTQGTGRPGKRIMKSGVYVPSKMRITHAGPVLVSVLLYSTSLKGEGVHSLFMAGSGE